MVITRNLCLDQMKKDKGKQFVDMQHIEIRALEATPAHRYEQTDGARKMQALMQHLPEQQKLVVQLRDVEGFSFEEVEQITGLTINYIRVLLSRARKTLRDEFLKMEHYD